MVAVGDSGSVEFVVTEDATASALGSGDVPVLGTPKVIALCEGAAVAAIAGSLPEGSTTVGTRIAVDHVAPTPVGGTVVASAVVTHHDGRSIELDVKVVAGDATVASGRHTRAVVDRERFIARLDR